MGSSQNQQEDWRTNLEKEGTRATVDLQVARIIQYHGQENTRESMLGKDDWPALGQELPSS